ncbi:MAG TPA: PKD domain-containing protein [Candidatus Sulfotelmatobacter sp.]|jgi:hypothetical protein|nr:PKD domain-containing protein [Candidatus Sulfotelmatobacter sp.]
MKKIIALVFILFLFLPNTAYANGAGLPTFFKINGLYSKPNPLQVFGITAQTFLLPQDYSPENYIVNQPITFAIDQSPLTTVIPSDLMKKTTYVWNYGDGSNKEEGLGHTHIYKKIGSYILILTINVSYDQYLPPTQFIDSYFLNILPQKEYQGLPQAVIKLNGQVVNDSLSNKTIHVNFKSPILFNATSSRTTSPIIQYLWDFGDDQTGTKPVMQHNYYQGQNTYDNAIVVLQIQDKNGFISDTFIRLYNDPSIKNNTDAIIKNNKSPFIATLTILLSGLLVIGLLVLIFFLNKRKQNKLKDSTKT